MIKENEGGINGKAPKNNSPGKEDSSSTLGSSIASSSTNGSADDSGSNKLTISSTKQATSNDSNNNHLQNTSNKIIPEYKEAKRRKMELSWCGRDSCTFFDEGLREKVVGEHNEIIFDSPATGQVAYQWADVPQQNEQQDSNRWNITLSKVLILVKRNDDELLKAASEVRLFFHVETSSVFFSYR